MKYSIYAVRDCLNGFGTPMCDHNDETASRNFRNALKNPDFFCPSDYDLFRIGEYDVGTGMIIPEPSPVLIYRGLDVKKEIENNVTT